MANLNDTLNTATYELIQKILAGIQAAISAAPGVLNIVEKGKALIASLFGAGVITKDQQDALHAHVDSMAALAATGIIPDHWKVEADPTNPPV
jgi:hypothetical protein